MTTLTRTLKSCPFCGGKAMLERERNCDRLTVDHAEGCFIGALRDLSEWHFGENPKERPFSDWDARAPRGRNLNNKENP